MIIDVHTHTFPKAIRENREKYFPEEPAFKILYESPHSRLVSASEIVSVMDQENVDISVIFGFPWKNPETFKMQNDYILESVAKYPDRLIGFGCFDPFAPSASVEAKRCLDAGLAGIGELAFYESGIDESCLVQLAPIMAICENQDKIVMIHTNEPVGHQYPGKTPNTLSQIYKMIKKFPDNKIILAHWGGGIFFYNLLKKEVKESLKNIYFDTAATPFLYKPEIYKIAAQIGILDKILFGTDYPLLKPARYFKELNQSGLKPDEIKKICGENAARLLKTDKG